MTSWTNPPGWTGTTIHQPSFNPFSDPAYRQDRRRSLSMKWRRTKMLLVRTIWHSSPHEECYWYSFSPDVRQNACRRQTGGTRPSCKRVLRPAKSACLLPLVAAASSAGPSTERFLRGWPPLHQAWNFQYPNSMQLFSQPVPPQIINVIPRFVDPRKHLGGPKIRPEPGPEQSRCQATGPWSALLLGARFCRSSKAPRVRQDELAPGNHTNTTTAA